MSFDRMWADLEGIGRDRTSGGYRRFAWTREDHTLREWFAGECAALGLDVVEDRAGNQWAWWGDPDSTPGVATGSHLDSVPDGGAYDGPLGVVSSLLSVKALQDKGITPNRPLGVVNFVDEEGARFGVACAGSRVITGALSAERALGLTDADGTSMAQALQAAGRGTDELGADDAAVRRVASYVELHVEQGRALAPLGASVGIGTDIWPHGRWRADLPGRADHAGTTALTDRDDAMLKAASFITRVREAAAARDRSEDGGERVAATVGKLDVLPGGVNAIASHVTAWVDARASRESDVQDVVRELDSYTKQLGGVWHEESWTPTTRFDPELLGRMSDLLGHDVPMLGTGAGHDAGILANHGIPTAMLFVRNPTGTSHSPEEFAERDDCLHGVQALTRVLEAEVTR